MQKEMSASEIEARFAEITSREPEQMTRDEELSLAEAETMDDGTTVTLNEYMNQPKGAE